MSDETQTQKKLRINILIPEHYAPIDLKTSDVESLKEGDILISEGIEQLVVDNSELFGMKEVKAACRRQKENSIIQMEIYTISGGFLDIKQLISLGKTCFGIDDKEFKKYDDILKKYGR